MTREGEDLFGQFVRTGWQRVAAALLEGLEELLGRVFPSLRRLVLPLTEVLIEELGEVREQQVFAPLAVELQIGPPGVRLEVAQKSGCRLHVLEFYKLLRGGDAHGPRHGQHQ